MRKVAELSLEAFTSGSERERAQFTDALFTGLKEYGFIILKDHAIDVDLLHEAYRASERFFALPESNKSNYDVGHNRGYTAFGREHAKNSKHPDLKEFFHVGRDLEHAHPLKPLFPDNVWPVEVEDFKDIFEEVFTALDDTGRTMLRALTGPLRVEGEYFSRLTNAGASTLRLLHYPPIPAGADPNRVRAAAHEDINLITLLVSASSSGLELLTRDGEWLPVDTAADNIIVDAGDMLARITNDVIPATTHRVVNPRGPNVSRYSMPFFMHPNPDAVLSCIDSCRGAGARYPDITERDLRMERLRAIGIG